MELAGHPLTANPTQRAARYRRIVAVGCALGAATLFAAVTETLALAWAHVSVQVDFDDFYTAGQAVHAGLDPYVNNYPDVWDGFTTAHFTGFIYTPFAGWIFQLFAVFPYATVKLLWTAAQPIFFLISCALSSFWAVRQKNARLYALVGALLGGTFFFPLLFEIERGQLDLALLLCALTAGLLTDAGEATGARHYRPLIAGFLIGTTAMFKLHMLYLVPLFLLRGQKRLAAAITVAVLASGVLQWLLLPAVTQAYLLADFPRIAQQGALLPAPTQHVVIQGVTYAFQRSDLAFHPVNASLARALLLLLPSASYTVFSVTTLAVLLGVVLLVVPSRRYRHLQTGEETMTFWLCNLCVVLLAAPLTWTMNVVWLLVSVPLLFVWPGPGWAPGLRVAWVLLLSGLALAALPDGVWHMVAPGSPGGFTLFGLKYVLAIILVFSACLVRLRTDEKPVQRISSVNSAT